MTTKHYVSYYKTCNTKLLSSKQERSKLQVMIDSFEESCNQIVQKKVGIDGRVMEK